MSHFVSKYDSPPNTYSVDENSAIRLHIVAQDFHDCAIFRECVAKWRTHPETLALALPGLSDHQSVPIEE